MGKFLKIEAAAQLTGHRPEAIRRTIMSVLNVGSKDEQKLIKQNKKGHWKIHTSLLNRILDPPRAENGKTGKPSDQVDAQPPDEWMTALTRQMETKDRQIARMQQQMSQLIERNREMNIMLHRLQERLALEPSNRATDFTNNMEEQENSNEAKDDHTPASFAEWARRFR